MYLIDMHFHAPGAITPELSARHRDHLAAEYATGDLIFGGRKIPRTGGLIFSRHDSLDQVRRLMESDPLVLADLATFTVTEFETVMATEAYSDLLPTTDR